MNFLTVVKKRRSIRKYKNIKIDQKKINKILKIASFSPSAGNLQARSFIIIKNKNLIKKIASLRQEWITQAPVLIVVCANLKESKEKFIEKGEVYALQDATIFASYLQLTATSEGLSTCWIGSFDEEKIKELLKIPKDLKPIALIPLGFADEKPAPRPRKKLSELIFRKY